MPVEGTHGTTVFVRPSNVVADPDGVRVKIQSISYRGGHWEAVASEVETHVDVMLDLPSPARVGDEIGVRFTGGWVLPG